MTVHYAPGGDALVAVEGCTLLLRAEPSDPRIAGLWAALEERAAEVPGCAEWVNEVLDQLIERFGLRGVPEFVVLCDDVSGTAAVLRGTIGVRHAGVEVSGAPASGVPWISTNLAPGTVMAGEAPADEGLPLRAGIVGAAGVRVGAAEVAVGVDAARVVDVGDPDDLGEVSEPGPSPQEATRIAVMPVAPGPESEVHVDPEVEDRSGYTALFSRTGNALGSRPEPDTSPALPHVALGSDSRPVSQETQVPENTSTTAPGGIIDGVPNFRSARATPIAPATPLTPPAVAVARTPATDGASGTATVARSGLGFGQGFSAVETVLGMQCPNGHIGRPDASFCRACGTPLAGRTPAQYPRPVLGVLHLPGGEVLELDRGVVFGRSPAEPEGSTQRHHLINVSAYGPHLSRMHLEVVLDEWLVLVRDLGSTEGTVVTLPGRSPERLRPQELFTLAHDTQVNLAGDYTFVFRMVS